MEALQADIAAARENLQQMRARNRRSEEEINEAADRQRLRRELDAINEQIATEVDEIEENERYAVNIENDDDGPHLNHSHPRSVPKDPAPTDNEAVVCSHSNCTDAVVSGELEWTIQGMSWLKSTLRQQERRYVSSDHLTVGHNFFLRYAPTHSIVHTRWGPPVLHTISSLAIVHNAESPGLTFRHSFFVKRNDGEFVQWGDTAEESHVPAETCVTWHFGPDTKKLDVPAWRGTGQAAAAGIFGLSHEELLRSEWVKDDAMTIKVKLEVRLMKPMARSRSHLQVAAPQPAIELPPPSLGSDLLAQLEAAASESGGDVTFTVEGEQIRAHSFVLCARSEVFSHMLRGPMREAASHKVIIPLTTDH